MIQNAATPKRSVCRATVLLAVLFSFASSAVSMSSAEAQKTGPGGLRFEGHGTFGWYSDAGAGFRIDVPLLPEGFVNRFDDSLHLSVGADLLWFYHSDFDGLGAYPTAAAQWNVNVIDRWTFFAEVGATGLFAPNRRRYWKAAISPYTGAGGRYQISDRWTLLFRISWPSGFHLGVTF